MNGTSSTTGDRLVGRFTESVLLKKAKDIVEAKKRDSDIFDEEAEKANGDGAFPKCNWGIDGITGNLVDMEEFGIWEPFSVKIQTIKTAVESACMILYV